MTLIGYRASNHPQQVAKRAANEDVDDRATHPAEFARLSERYGPFTLDVAAAAHNAKCDRYFDRETDGLAQSWAGERVWCNPPYSSIEPWVEKAWAEMAREPMCAATWGTGAQCRTPYWNHVDWKGESKHGRGNGWGHDWVVPRIVMLLPGNRAEQGWWQRHVEPHRDRPGSGLRVEFLPGRMRFIKRGQTDVGPNERPPFGCCLLIWEAVA